MDENNNVVVRVSDQQFIRGEDGYSPVVTIENIDHGHSVNITDREHPEGQTFNVMDGASAYEQAAAGGYEGTEEQFNADLSSFKTLHGEVEEVAPFYAVYGVTTKAEIEAAINNKRQIYLNRGGGLGGVVAPYTGTFLYADIWGEGTGYRFALTNGNFQHVYELKSEWTYSIYDLTAPAQRAETAAAQALTRMNSADASAQAAAGSAGDASTAATTATTKAGEASDSATAADGSAKDSEAYAIGKRGGTDVGSSDPAYHNNAKYYAQQASGSATAASGSATAAASSATAAGNAQTAAETAQGAAEDAQAAAEAVLDSIPEDYTELSGDVDDLKSAFDADLFADRYVKYNSLTSYGFSANANRPSFSRYGNRFAFSGTINSAYYFVKLSEEGSTNTTTGITVAKAWPKPVEYKTGHIYKACFTLLSGSYSGSPLISLFGSDNSRVNIGIGEEITFTPGPIFSNVVYVGANGASFDNAVFSFTIEDITEEGLTTYDQSVVGAINELNENTKGLAYSWWINNTATDSYGTLYFGYISDKSMVGVGCRYADGTVKRHDLFASENNDDHNAPSVIIIPIDEQEHVCVIGSTGHNTDSKINVFVADEPNTIGCTFTDKTHTITAPTGYRYLCSYSQAYYDSANSTIINFFRLKQVNTSDSTFHMVWMCAKSTDNGSTWSIYRVFTITEDGVLFYMFSANTMSSHIMRMILQVNTTYAQYKPLKAGLINTKSGNIFDNTMTNIQKPMTLVPDGGLVYDTSVTIANYDDFTTMVEIDGDKRLRILDVFTTVASSNKACFLYAKSVESSTTYRDLVHWDLYRSYNGTTVKVGELGIPFFYGSLYVTGASFIGDVDHLVYCKNDSTVQDYLHSMHLVALENNAVTSDSIIKRAARTLARPKRYDSGSIMYLIGKYREGAGTKYLTWHFSIGFLDSI